MIQQLYKRLIAFLLFTAAVYSIAAQDGLPEKKLKFFPLPIVYYTPETEWAFGAAMVFSFQLGKQDSLTKPSQLQIGTAYTLLNQFLLYLPFQLIFPKDRYRLFGELGYYRYNYLFYGIGNDFEDYGGETYGVNFPRVRISFQKRLADHFYGGIRYWLDDYRITELEEGGLLATREIAGKGGNVVSGTGLVFTFDNRDQLYYTRKGQFIELGWLANTSWLGGEFTFDKFTLDARHFIPLGKKAALGLNAYAELTFGDPAFNQLALLGGPKRLRGYLEGRFRDNHYLLLQTEYRFPLFWRLGGVIFGGYGAVADQLDHFAAENWRYSFGIGLRLTLLPEDKINLRLDYGLGQNSSGFYFTIGEAF
ncbi:MAG: membrane protein [Saprospiraceae bacterium]|nr:MAG: membrane protein [Saprospiraceae bacterium]